MGDDRPLIRLRLEADDVPEGEIALSDLAKIAGSTQKILRQIAGNLVGQRGPGAPRRGVKEASSLRLVGLRPGSTILEIAGAEADAGVLNYDVPTDLTELSFDMLVGGLSAVSADEPQPDLPIGFDEHLVHDLDEWLKTVRKYKSVTLESHVRDRTRAVKTQPIQARLRLHALSPQPALPFVSSTEQALEGRLYALNLNTGSFSIEDDAGHKIRTDVPPSFRGDAAVLINRRVRAVGKPELDEGGRLKAFTVSSLGPAPDLAGLSEQKGFFEPHQLDVKPPAGESGTLDEWAIQSLSNEEVGDFMSALTGLR